MAMELGVGLSIRQCLKLGYAIDFGPNTVSFGKGFVNEWPWVDSYVFVTNAVGFDLFKNVSGTIAGTGNSRSNVVSTQVPGAQRWDLTGMHMFINPLAGTTSLPEATYDALRTWIMSASYTMSINNVVLRTVPMLYNFGSKGFQNIAITPTLALQTPDPVAYWGEKWGEEFFIPMQSGVTLDFSVTCAAVPAAINGMTFSVGFERDLANQ